MPMNWSLVDIELSCCYEVFVCVLIASSVGPGQLAVYQPQPFMQSLVRHCCQSV